MSDQEPPVTPAPERGMPPFRAGETLIKVEAVTAGYGKETVLEAVSLDVAAGETYGLIGLNGAGKTTLLKIMLGLKDAQEGIITIAGLKAGETQAKTVISYLPERFDPPWFFSAYEFIDFTLSLYGAKAARAEVDSMAVRLGLDVFYLSRQAKSYSKGMRQKLGLMAAFMAPAPFLMLDEPMSGLDPQARAQVKDLMLEARAQGRTCFLSSHILADLEELCDRVAVLHDRRIRFAGPPQELMAATRQKYLERAFLAKINDADALAA